MAPVVNLPAGYAMSTLTFRGAAVPLGAAVVLGHQLTGTSQTAAGVAGVVAGAWTAGLFSSGGPYPPSLILDTVLVKFGPLATGPSAVAAVGTAAGSGGGEAYNPGTAILVSKFTALGGRRGRGRMYLPPLTESGITEGGKLLAAQVTNLQGYANSFLASLNTGNVPMVLLHRYDPDAGESPVAPTLVTGLTVQATLATQRGRLRR